MKAFLALFGLAAVGAGVAYVMFTSKPSLPPGTPEPTTFSECEKYYPVTDRLPRVCINGAGAHITEDIGNTLDHPTMQLSKPMPGAVLSSPTLVQGYATAEWFQEDTYISVSIYGPKGELLGQDQLAAKTVVQKNMSNRFEGPVRFEKPTFGTTGTFVVTKQNGRQALRIPVSFK